MGEEGEGEEAMSRCLLLISEVSSLSPSLSTTLLSEVTHFSSLPFTLAGVWVQRRMRTEIRE